jgi:glycosyltransferase involved in cell wall biosynthesis
MTGFQEPNVKSQTRVIGLDLEFIEDHHKQSSRNAKLYHALEQQFTLVTRKTPNLTRLENIENRIRHFYPNRALWILRRGLNPWIYGKYAHHADTILCEHHDQFDVVFQLAAAFQTSSEARQGKPYTLFADNTLSITRRMFPAWHPLTRAEWDRCMEFEAQIHHNAAFTFTYTEFTRQAIINDYGLPPEKVIWAGAGTNLKLSSLEGKRWDRQVALFVGYEFERKGGYAVLGAWDEVRRKLPKAELWIVGPKFAPRGVDKPGVKFFGLMNDRQQLSRMFFDATTFVMPSQFDPCPHVLRESMGYGMPCITSTQGALPEIIRNNQNGRSVPVGDSQAIADALIHLLGNPEEAERMGRYGFDLVNNVFSWEKVVERMHPYLEAAARGLRQPVSSISTPLVGSGVS